MLPAQGHVAFAAADLDLGAFALDRAVVLDANHHRRLPAALPSVFSNGHPIARITTGSTRRYQSTADSADTTMTRGVTVNTDEVPALMAT
jgi:hypothetical protein